MPRYVTPGDRLTPLLWGFVLACGTPDVEPDTAPATPAVSTRLPPSAFADLSSAIVEDLTGRNCTIPQSFPDTVPHNVVRGQFTSRGQIDIAVLCLRDTTSVILVYRGGVADSVAEIAPRAHLQAELTDTSSVFSFSRAVSVVDSAFIQSRFERYGGPKPPTLDHHGVNDLFVGKASIVWYWHRGQWLQLQGSD